MAKQKYHRTCTSCGKGMNEGYLNEESSDTYCSRKCAEDDLGKHTVAEALDTIIVGGEDEDDEIVEKFDEEPWLFWTEWTEDD